MSVAAKRSCRGKKKRILEAIPYDEFVRAGEIASKAEVSPETVGIFIRWNLMPLVEVMEIDEPKPGTRVYKRRMTGVMEENTEVAIEVSP